MKRGFSLITNQRQNIIKSLKDVAPEEVLDITVTDGVFRVKVLSKER